jgi:hypothetical protein
MPNEVARTRAQEEARQKEIQALAHLIFVHVGQNAMPLILEAINAFNPSEEEGNLLILFVYANLFSLRKEIGLAREIIERTKGLPSKLYC